MRRVVDGVSLSTRTEAGDGDGGEPGSAMADLIRKVIAISRAYDVPASDTIETLYVDDKNCALYEIDIATDIPPSWAVTFACEITEIFREPQAGSGYNGIVFRHAGRVIREEDPWWWEFTLPDAALAGNIANDNHTP